MYNLFKEIEVKGRLEKRIKCHSRHGSKGEKKGLNQDIRSIRRMRRYPFFLIRVVNIEQAAALPLCSHSVFNEVHIIECVSITSISGTKGAPGLHIRSAATA